MVMGVSMEELIERLGHDGKEIILEEVTLPNGYRAFHPEEFVDLLLEDGFTATMVTANPTMSHGPMVVDHSQFLGYKRFFDTMKLGSGVIFGVRPSSGLGHAVAWNNETQLIYDPRGKVYDWDSSYDYTPLQFYLIQEAK